METTLRSIREHATPLMALLLLAFLLAYILPIGLRPLAIPDETRYAEIPREMLVSGDWVVPHLIGLRYFEKPALGYWLSAVSISLFGEDNFAVRLPSALSMGMSAWFIWLLMISTGHGRQMALVAAAVYLTLLEVLILGTIALLDTPFSLFLTGGMVLFYLGVDRPDDIARQRRYLSASGVMFGLAFLTKGFLAFALPGIVLLPFILITKHYNLLWRSAWVILFTLLTIAPWAIAIHIREPDFWHYFIWEEHIRRFLSPNAQHASPAYFYILSLPIMAFPWFSMIPAAIAGHLHKRPNVKFLWFLILWAIIPFLFFSISKGKLVTYILPCLAPTAILIAIGLVYYLQAGKGRWFILGVIFNALTLGSIFFFLLYQEYAEGASPMYLQSEMPALIVMLGSLLLATLMMLSTAFFQSYKKRILILMCASAILLPAFNTSLPKSMLVNKSPSYIIQHTLDKIDSHTILVSDANVVRSVAWTFKRTDIYLLHRGELQYGLSYPEHTNKLLGLKGLEELLIKQQAGEVKNTIAVFCEEPCSGSLTSLLGHRAEKMSNNEFAVWLIRAGE